SREGALLLRVESFPKSGLEDGQFVGPVLLVVQEQPHPSASGRVAGDFVVVYRSPGIRWIQDIWSGCDLVLPFGVISIVTITKRVRCIDDHAVTGLLGLQDIVHC